MASVPGGLIFADSTNGAAHVGFKSATTLNNNGALGTFNVEIFTGLAIGAPQPTLDTGYQVGVNAPGASLSASGFVDATQVQLYAGNYQVIDEAANGSPNVEILAGSGNQTIFGAKGDTLVGSTSTVTGTGNTVLDASGNTSGVSGGESVVGGVLNYTIQGGIGTTIAGSGADTSVTSGDIVAGGKDIITLQTAGSEIVTLGIGDTIVSGGASSANILLGLGGNDSVNFVGNTGNEVILGTAVTTVAGAGDTVTAGNGNATMVGAVGETFIGGGAGSSDFIVASDDMTVQVGAAGKDLIFAGVKDTLVGGGGVAVVFVGKGDIVNFTTQSGASSFGPGDTNAGNDLIALGSGLSTVFGSTGDTINLGSVGQYAVGFAGGMNIAVGSAGTDSIWGSTVAGSADTISGGAAAATIFFLGKGDVVNFSGETGTANIVGSGGGKNVIKLGSGLTNLTGAAGDTVVGGTGGLNIDGTSGGMRINVGGGATTVVGSSGATGDTIIGGKGNLLYDPGSKGGDVIDLSGSSATATINAFGSATTLGATNDSIIGSLKADSVWGGGGDTIGLANVSTTVGNTHVWTHSGPTTGSVDFGTFNTGTGSTATVTIGGSATNDFVSGVDRLFYPGDNTATDTSIVAAAKNVTGGVSIVLPDGSTMTILGQTAATLSVLNTAGKLFTA